MAERRKAKPDEWDDKAQRQADEFIKQWDKAAEKLWDKTAKRLAEDFERNLTDSWGAPSPNESEGSTEDARDSVERSLDELFEGLEGEQ